MTTTRWRRRIALLLAMTLGYGLAGVPTAHAAEPPMLDPVMSGGTAQNAFSGAPRAWQYERIKPDRAWALTGPNGAKLDGTGVKVAVLDTGAAVTNTPYFDPGKVRSFNLVGDDADVKQKADKGGKYFLDCLHGTMVVSLINGQRVDNGSNFSGMAPGATVYAMRVLQTSDKKEPQDALVRPVDGEPDTRPRDHRDVVGHVADRPSRRGGDRGGRGDRQRRCERRAPVPRFLPGRDRRGDVDQGRRSATRVRLRPRHARDRRSPR